MATERMKPHHSRIFFDVVPYICDQIQSDLTKKQVKWSQYAFKACFLTAKILIQKQPLLHLWPASARQPREAERFSAFKHSPWGKHFSKLQVNRSVKGKLWEAAWESRAINTLASECDLVPAKDRTHEYTCWIQLFIQPLSFLKGH